MLTKKNSVEFQFKRMMEFKVKHYPNYNKSNENVKKILTMYYNTSDILNHC